MSDIVAIIKESPNLQLTFQNGHIHSNKPVLDAITEAFTTAIKDYIYGIPGGITAIQALQLDLNGATPEVGQLTWDTTYMTGQLGLVNGSMLQMGQELLVYGKALEVINNGQLVQLAGTQGNHNTFKKAVPSEYSANPYLVLGIATNNFTTNGFGYVTWFGKVNNVYTTGFHLFDPIWADPMVIGGITDVEPIAPNPKIKLGSVVKLATGSAENGIFALRPFFMPKLGGLQDVYAPSPTDGQVLTYNATTLRWEATTPQNEGTYVHTQMVASDTWTITHNLNSYPSVSVVDSADSVVIGDVHYFSTNQLVVSFIGEFSGKAYLN